MRVARHPTRILANAATNLGTCFWTAPKEKTMSNSSMNGTALVTGASTGIGHKAVEVSAPGVLRVGERHVSESGADLMIELSRPFSRRRFLAGTSCFGAFYALAKLIPVPVL